MKRGLADNQTELSRCKLFPFVANSTTAYVIEAGPGYFRFWTGDTLILTNAGNIVGTGVISALGEPLKIATPYNLGALREIQWAHANDIEWFVHPSYPPYKLTRFLADAFSFEPMAFVFPPLRDTNVSETSLAVTGDLSVGGSVTITAAGGDVFEAGDVGGYYGIDHRRASPFAEISLSQGSGTASAILSITATPSAGETFIIGKGTGLQVYTWGSEGAYGVPIGTGADPENASLDNATAAINVPSSLPSGVTVNPGTIAHAQVSAENLGKFTAGIKASGILTFTDNDLTAGTPDEIDVGAQSWAFTLDCTTGPANRIQVGATLADSIQNAIYAISGIGGVAGVNFTAGTTASADVDVDAAPIGNTLRAVAKAAGAAGNDITTGVDHTSRMSWGSSTLTGGADAGTWKMQITARIEGAAGNEISTAETMANGAWQPAPAPGDPSGFLTGGADNTNYDPSNAAAVIPTVRVTGQWEVYTLGRWYGTLTLQQQRGTTVPPVWETVRTWDSQNDKNYQATGTVDGEKTMRLTFVGSGIADDEAPARAVLTAVDAIVHGLVLITGYVSPTVVTGTVVKAVWSSEPTYLWAGGSWSDRRGYPSAVVLHQQRLVFGQGARIIGSQTGGFDNFFRGELADDSYQFDLAATVQTNIVSMQSQAGLIILTETDEWLADGGGQGTVISPDSIRTQQLTAYGSAKGASQIVHSNVIFIQAGNLIANEYLFNFGQQNYEAVDLGELADHLTREKLAEIAWAPVPNSLIYFITEAGSLLSLAYRRSGGNANEGGILAWTLNNTADGGLGLTQDLNDIGTGYGKFESVCCIPAENEITDVWVSIRRQLPDGSFVRTIESFDSSYWDHLQGGSNVNLCLTDGTVKSGILLPGVPDPLTGLDHLEGLTVSVLINGYVTTPCTVSGGQIQPDYPAGTASPATVIAGLPVQAEIQPWFAVLAMKDGGSDGRRFNVAALNIRFYLAGACQMADGPEGPYFDIDFRQGSDPINVPTPLKTGLVRWSNAGKSRIQSEFILRNFQPLPMSVLGITAELTVTSHK